ncbi:hypothetical protein PV325_011741, partial [Microctonus aethiopoides]
QGVSLFIGVESVYGSGRRLGDSPRKRTGWSPTTWAMPKSAVSSASGGSGMCNNVRTDTQCDVKPHCRLGLILPGNNCTKCNGQKEMTSMENIGVGEKGVLGY